MNIKKLKQNQGKEVQKVKYFIIRLLYEIIKYFYPKKRLKKL